MCNNSAFSLFTRNQHFIWVSLFLHTTLQWHPITHIYIFLVHTFQANCNFSASSNTCISCMPHASIVLPHSDMFTNCSLLNATIICWHLKIDHKLSTVHHWVELSSWQYTVKCVRLSCLRNRQKQNFENGSSLHVQNLFNHIHCYTCITGVMGRPSRCCYCHRASWGSGVQSLTRGLIEIITRTAISVDWLLKVFIAQFSQFLSFSFKCHTKLIYPMTDDAVICIW